MAENIENQANNQTATDTNASAFKKWTLEHPDLWEFIKFNGLSQISTVVRFVLLWILTPVFVGALGLTAPFHFAFYNYDSAAGGVGIFLATIITEIIAQTVNFFVQMKWVFNSDASFMSAAWKYVILSLLIIMISGFAPSYINEWANSIGWGAAASTLSAVFNTIAATIVAYPLLKFWIAPKSKDEK
ncbi:PTS cellobiose transporter subunit IIC [Alloscardovia theropitheci]|uniref:PTS cellobiose transporter subunit IIC n=1 Tax=Alloscardovia theropitheci TaxID=2496842 RepID=A0A4R0QSZ3_9BIFI|nr:GtrA family protein [Alloscardovia theropitheci]TCD54315.1 PTS cellobiose transporter subunit IIC [Alloscardovia theropitheci]